MCQASLAEPSDLCPGGCCLDRQKHGLWACGGWQESVGGGMLRGKVHSSKLFGCPSLKTRERLHDVCSLRWTGLRILVSEATVLPLWAPAKDQDLS